MPQDLSGRDRGNLLVGLAASIGVDARIELILHARRVRAGSRGPLNTMSTSVCAVMAGTVGASSVAA